MGFTLLEAGWGSSGSGGGGGQHVFPALEALKAGEGVVVEESTGSPVTIGLKKVPVGEVPDGWALKDYAIGQKATMVIEGEIKKAPVVGANGVIGLPFPQENLYWDLTNQRFTTAETEGEDVGALLKSEWQFPILSATVQGYIDNDALYDPHIASWGVVPGGALNNSTYINQLKNKTIKLKTLGTKSGVTLQLPAAEKLLTKTVAVDNSLPGDTVAGISGTIDMGDVAAGQNITRVSMDTSLGATGFVYQVTKAFTGQLRVRFDGTWNVGIAIQLRRGTTKPSDSGDGQLVGTATNTGSNFSGDLNLSATELPAGSYFWFALSDTGQSRIISNRRIRLDGTFDAPDPNYYVKTGDGAIFYLPANATKQTTLTLTSGNFRLADGTNSASVVFPASASSPKIFYMVSDGTKWVQQTGSGWLKNTIYASHHMLIAGRVSGTGGIPSLTNVATTDQRAYTATLAGGHQPSEGETVIITPPDLHSFNTGSVTLSVNNGTAIMVKRVDGLACVGGEIRYDTNTLIRYDGTEWRILAQSRADEDYTVTPNLGPYSKAVTTTASIVFGGNALNAGTTWTLDGALTATTLNGGTLLRLETAWPTFSVQLAGIVQDTDNMELWYKDGSDPSSFSDGTKAGTYSSSGYTKSGTVSVTNAPVGRRFWLRLPNNNAATISLTVTVTSGGQDLTSAPITIPGRGLVFRKDLEGKETDRYANYDNALFGANYFSGNWCLFNQTTAPTDDTNAIRQPDIQDRSTTGVVLFGATLRADRDPNNLVWRSADTASDYVSGQVIYASIWNDRSAHVAITLTSDGTLVGTGTGAYIWATATWDEVNDLPDVVDYGDYMLLSQEAPSTLRIEIPASDVIGGTFVKTDGSNVTTALKNAIQGDNEEVTLAGDFRVDVTNVSRYVQFTEPGGGTPNTISIRIPNTDTQNKTDLQRLLRNSAWVEVGGYTLDITTNATIATLPSSFTFTSNYVVVSGTKPTGSTTRKVHVVGEDIHRGEMSRQAFKLETPSIAGMGGFTGAHWRRGTTNENASWFPHGEEQITLTSGITRNALTGTTGYRETAPLGGTIYLIQANRVNTGAATLALNGGSAKAIKRRDGKALTGGELRKDVMQSIYYDGTQWLLLEDVRPEFPIGEELNSGTYDSGLRTFTPGTWLQTNILLMRSPSNAFQGNFVQAEKMSRKDLLGGTLYITEARFPYIGISFNSLDGAANSTLYYKDGADPTTITDGTALTWSGGQSAGNPYYNGTNWPQGRRFWVARNGGGTLNNVTMSLHIESQGSQSTLQDVFHNHDTPGRWSPHTASLTGTNADLVTGLSPDDYVKIVATSDDGITSSLEGVFKDLEARNSGVLLLELEGMLDRFDGAITSTETTVFTGVQDRDIIQIGMRYTALSNKRAATLTMKYSALQDGTWYPAWPDSGFRLTTNISGGTLKTQLHGNGPTDAYITAERIAKQNATFTLGSNKIQAKRNSYGAGVFVQCWVLPEGG